MKDAAPKAILLKDYKKPAYLVPELYLNFLIYDDFTTVKSKMKVEANYETEKVLPLTLNGHTLQLVAVFIDGHELNQADYDLTDHELTVQPTKKNFTLEVETRIQPQHNKALEGLYQSGQILCTQNEPEGFRRITYFLDRSDVMSVYTTRIEADKKHFPILLSNGNQIQQGDLDNGRHFVVWNDPFKKPSYLFALVAGDLAKVEDSYKTLSGKKVKLEIFVDHGNENRSQHALDSLKKAMKWDEDVFGLEYDLDIYMIVAVDAFNMGAMENKGLNIFNSTCALANPQTATDANFQSIEGIIAHEYFHNWTGNRVTCRDWFQLTLKEGLTVFRDQEFSMEMTSKTVKRIEEVDYLRNAQFTEDSGPTAHPIKPASYIEINNFYTPTVYRKGAEVIRMIHTLIGKENFRLGMDKYFELFDGQAVTTEDFVMAMELASGRDLTQFKNWYHQAGTPRLELSSSYDRASHEYTLKVTQWCPPTPECQEKKPFHLPLKLGLLDASGKDMPLKLKEGKLLHNDTLELTHSEHSFVFTDIKEEPVPSLLRSFCAPVILNYDYSNSELAFLLANDNDEFNRYEAAQRLATIELESLLCAVKSGEELCINPQVLAAFGQLIKDQSVDVAFKAEALGLPSITSLVERMAVCDYDGAFMVREALKKAIGLHFEAELVQIYSQTNIKVAYSIDPKEVGRRRLKNTALAYLCTFSASKYIELAGQQFTTSDNMTDKIAALAILADFDHPIAHEAIEEFYRDWQSDTLVMNKWFTVQASSKRPNILKKVKELEKNPAYDNQNPNKIRSLIAAFANNRQFHDISGDAYQYLAEKIIEIDKFNPSAAAGLAKCFRKYGKMDVDRQGLMKIHMEKILAEDKLSKDVYEVISKTLI